MNELKVETGLGQSPRVITPAFASGHVSPHTTTRLPTTFSRSFSSYPHTMAEKLKEFAEIPREFVHDGHQVRVC